MYLLNENVDKIHSTIKFCQTKFSNDLLVCKLWKRTDFHLFTKTIPENSQNGC